jgi:hypothetical protein
MLWRRAALATALAFGACTVQTPVPASSVPAADVVEKRAIVSPTSVWMSPDVGALKPQVRSITEVCGAFVYPLSLGAGLAETLERTNEAALKRRVSGGTGSAAAAGAAYHIIIELDDVRTRLSVSSGWGPVASADAEVVLRVRVIDAAGDEVFRTTVAGEGAADESIGTCEDSANALSAAAAKSVKRVAESYVEKVINAGAFH